ncbi:MAG: recombinase family protein [Anaerolineae bacterium]|nr:recombinase family protein [Anaerolineae bacterium]
MHRAVIYARVSGDDRSKEGRNLESQLRLCREHALRIGHRVVAEMAEDDRGASGADRDLPQLKRLLEMARAGEVDVVIVREMDRLARSLVKQLLIEEQLQSLDIAIEMPYEFVNQVSSRYIELYEKITGDKFQKAEASEVMNRIEKNVIAKLNELL